MSIRTWASWLLIAYIAWPAVARAEKVSVEENDGLYTIAGTFTVEVSPSVTWSALTSYNVNLYASALVTDRIERLSDGRVLLHQTLSTKRDGKIHLIMEAREDLIQRTVSIRDTLSEDFQGYESRFQVDQCGEHSLVHYMFKARPKFDWYQKTVFVRKGLVGIKVQGVINRIQKELNQVSATPSKSQGKKRK